MMNITDPRVIYAPPSLDDIEQDNLPDPEGYFVGQEEYSPGEKDNDYDDMYEPDVLSYDYGFND